MTNLLWILILIFPLLGFWNYGLFDLDEGFYAAITAEMIKNKNYIIPTYQGVPWFEKPILLYWAATLSYYLSFFLPAILSFIGLSSLFYKRKYLLTNKILLYTGCLFLFFISYLGLVHSNLNIYPFRSEEFVLRLPSFLATIGLYGGIYYWLKKWTTSITALMATLICSTSLLTVAIGKLMLTDALYTCLLTNAFLSYYHSLTYNPKSKIWTGVFLGFAMLAKGPVAPFLFGVIALIAHIVTPALNKRSYVLLALGAFLSIISLWYLPIYLAMPETFWSEFIINQNIQRFLGGDKAHKINSIFLSFIYYIPILFFALFPWTLKLKKNFQESSPLSTYLKIWLGVIFIFFTLSQSKLPHYIFPCVPPLAILLALQVPETDFKSKKFINTQALNAFLLFAITQVFFVLWYTKFHPEEMIARQVALDINHFYIPGELKKIPVKNIYWYDSKELKKGPLGLSLTSHPSASFYKILGHNPLEHKYLQVQPIIEITDFSSLNTPCALITRGETTLELSNYLKLNQVDSFFYCYPDTKTTYITLYIIKRKKDNFSIITPYHSSIVNKYAH